MEDTSNLPEHAVGANALTYEQMAQIYKALAHPYRLWLLDQLSEEGTCICTLVEPSGRTQPYISQQMRVLRRAGLVTARRSGRRVFYHAIAFPLNDRSSYATCYHTNSNKLHLPNKCSENSPPSGARLLSCTLKERIKMESNGNKFQNPWHGIPRQEIEWYPTVVDDRCVGCGLCVTSCGRKVFAFDYDRNRAVVANPYNCMVGCTTCSTVCTRDALEFPSPGYIRQVIRNEKLLRKTKDQIKEQRKKYDIAVVRATQN